MAVLKDLIVHGRSRFVNGAQFNTINTESIGAEQGIFNKLVATTLDAKTATVDDLTAKNAIVTGLLDVQGQMQTNSWTNANIATIDGSFYICPTISSEATVTDSGTTQISNNKFVYNSSGGTIVLTGTWATSGSLYLDDSATDWTLFSKVMITGEVLIGNEWTPIGTIRGTLNGINTSAGTITIGNLSTNVTVKEGMINSVPAILSLVTSGTTYNARKLKVSLYEYNSSGTSSGATNLIGIMMTTAGTHGFTYLDIYNGKNSKTSYTSTLNNTTQATEPMVRIGNLNGLPNIVDGSNDTTTKPSGWGIYTTNGFFKGKIVSNAGIIANFTINGSKLYSNNHSTYNTAVSGIYIGDDYISFGSGGVTYFNTGGTGKIGPWTLSTTYFRNGNIANATNTTVSGVYLGTDGLNISNGTAATTSYITKSAVNIGNKLTWNGTTLSVTGAINATSLSTGTKTSSISGTGTYIDSSGNIYSGSGSANNFTVTSTGTLTATNANITGTIHATSGEFNGQITATSGKIGGWNISSTALCSATTYTPASGRILLAPAGVTTSSAIGNLPAATYAITAGSDFGVTTAGKLYASGVDIKGAITATSLTIDGTNYANDVKTISSKASGDAEYEVVIKVSSINYTTPSATLIAVPTKLGASTTGTFAWYKNAIGTAHGGTVSTTTNTNDTLTVTDLDALYIAVLQ